MEVASRQKHSPEPFVKTFGENVLHQKASHVVRLSMSHDILRKCYTRTTTTLPIFKTVCEGYHSCRTVEGHDIKQWCYEKTATTLPMFNRTRKWYHSYLTVDGEEIKIHLFTVGLTIWKPVQGKTFAANFSPREDFHMIIATVVDKI